MNKIKVISHRGGRGLDIENSVEAVRKAEAMGVDYIEVDVRVTKDRQLVLHHDRSLYFSCGANKMVDQVTFSQLRTMAKKAGHPLASLQEVLDAVKSTPLIIDIKEPRTADLLFRLMSLPRNHRHEWLANSRHQRDLLRIQKLDPRIKTIWTVDLIHPIRNIRQASKAGAFGVSMNFWVLNLLDYWAVKRAGMTMMVYIFRPRSVLNSVKVAKMLKLFYPDLWVSTERPDRILPIVRS